jgi:hypothetical protein
MPWSTYISRHGGSRHDLAQRPLAIQKRPLPQVFPVQPKQIECVKVRIPTPVHEPVELGVAVLVQAHDIAVEHRIFNQQVRRDRLA